ncbi:MAG: 6-pyruvoyl trahydropterin synthase family protein [Bacteroidales bacterium]
MKNIVRVTKEFSFEMAHRLEGYDGKCRNIHGHSYRLFICIMGIPSTDKKSPKLGMLMDFADLKHIVNEHIIQQFDHALMLNQTSPLCNITQLNNTQIVITPYQPTCENMVLHIAEILIKKLPKDISLHSIKLHETASSYAEWFAADNLENQ